MAVLYVGKHISLMNKCIHLSLVKAIFGKQNVKIN